MPKVNRRSARPRLEILEDRLAPAAFHVDHLADDLVGAGNTGSLRYCIEQANASPGASTIEIQSSGIIHLADSLHIRNSVTIIADAVSSVTLQGTLGTTSPAFRLLDIQGTAGSPIAVTLQHLGLINGDAGTGDGGAIESRYCDLTLTSCYFNNNTAANGGAVDVKDGSLVLQNGIVYGDNVTGNGGGISVSHATAWINHIYFLENGADASVSGPTSSGGAIFAGTGSSVTVTAAYFVGNVDTFGGGIGIYQASVVVTGCEILENVAYAGGGGIYADQAVSLTVINSSIDSCAARDGAGIFIEGGATDTAVTLTNSTVSFNSASHNAGGIDIDSTLGHIAVDLEACTIVYNGASGYAALVGGVYASSSGSGSTTIEYQDTLYFSNAAYGGGNLGVSDPQADRLVSLGHNLSNDGTGIIPGVNGDIKASPNIGPIGSFGGPLAGYYYLTPPQTVPILDGPGATGGVLLADAPNDERGIARPSSPSIGAAQYAEGVAQPGDGQTAPAYGAFAQPIGFRLTDNGHPVIYFDVVFTVTSGGATFAGGASTVTVQTDSTGLAEAMLTPGFFVGPVTVTAHVIGHGGSYAIYFYTLTDYTYHLTVAHVYDPPPTLTSLTTSKPTVLLGESFSLTGGFTAPPIVEATNIFVAHTVVITWGDGRTTSIDLAAQVYTFSATHAYTSGLPASSLATLPIGVKIEDTLIQTDFTPTSIKVQNVSPTLVIDTSDQFFNTASTFTRAGRFTDPDTDNTFALTVDYGDRTGVQTLAYDPETRAFGLAHDYSLEGSYSIIIKVKDGRDGDDLKSFDVDLLLPGVPTETAIKAKAKPGSTVTASEPGVTASLFHAVSKDDNGRLDASLLLAVVPPGVANGLDSSIALSGKTVSTAYDVRALNVGLLDRATVVFHYLSDNTNAPSLTYFDRASGQQKPVDPRFFVVDTTARTIALTLESSSTPSLLDLTGTVFTIAVPVVLDLPRISPPAQADPIVLAGAKQEPAAAADSPLVAIASGNGGVSVAVQVAGRVALAAADAVFSTGVVVATPPGVTQAMLSIARALLELPAVPESLITLPGPILTPGSAESPYAPEAPTPAQEMTPPAEVEASEQVGARDEVFVRLAGRPLEVSLPEAEGSWPGLTLAALAIFGGCALTAEASGAGTIPASSPSDSRRSAARPARRRGEGWNVRLPGRLSGPSEPLP